MNEFGFMTPVVDQAPTLAQFSMVAPDFQVSQVVTNNNEYPLVMILGAWVNTPSSLTGVYFTWGTATAPRKTVSLFTYVGGTPARFTATTSTAHGFSNGDVVTLSGIAPAEYNGTYVIYGVTTNTFNVDVVTSLTVNGAGTMVAQKEVKIAPGGTATLTVVHHLTGTAATAQVTYIIQTGRTGVITAGADWDPGT